MFLSPRMLARDFALTEVTEAGEAESVPIPTITETPKLDRWTVEAHVYTRDAAAKVGLLNRLFGGDAKFAQAGVIHEAKRFTSRKTEQRIVEVGVAVRLAAATTEWNLDVQLNLPTLAAEAQLSAKDARIGMEVLGYTGPLGVLLPAPKQLDVTTLSTYLEAFNKIQAQVFSETGLAFLAPTLLGYSPGTNGQPSNR